MFNTTAMIANLPLLLQGAAVTIVLSTAAYGIGIALGALACAAAQQDLYTVRWLARGYIDFFRTIPELVPIVWLYSCAPFVFQVDLSPTTVGLVAFSLISSSSFAEIFRTGLEAIPQGQRDAAKALGLSSLQTLWKVLVPQIIAIILPPSINLYSDIVKVSSLLSLIGVAELAYYTAVISASSYRYLEMYTLAGAIYLVMISAVSFLAKRLSRRFTRHSIAAGR